MTMNLIPLKGINGEYIYSPDSPDLILKAKGKFNRVFLGYRIDPKTLVVIKQLNANLHDNEQAVSRFKNEALELKHPNLVETYDYIFQENQHFIVREYIDGIDLASVRKNPDFCKKMDIHFILNATIQILDALAYLHDNKTYHCDLRPANILICKKDDMIDFKNPKVKLIDLGLAKTNKHIYQTFRTPFALIYSPPEQVLNFYDLVNASSDLYSLGITMYELLTRKLAFLHFHPEILINIQLTQKLKPNSKIPKGLFQILQKATSKYYFPKPPNRYSKEDLRDLLILGQSKRYQTASEFINDLLEFINTLSSKQNSFSEILKKIFK